MTPHTNNHELDGNDVSNRLDWNHAACGSSLGLVMNSEARAGKPCRAQAEGTVPCKRPDPVGIIWEP